MGAPVISKRVFIGAFGCASRGRNDDPDPLHCAAVRPTVPESERVRARAKCGETSRPRALRGRSPPRVDPRLRSPSPRASDRHALERSSQASCAARNKRYHIYWQRRTLMDSADPDDRARGRAMVEAAAAGYRALEIAGENFSATGSNDIVTSTKTAEGKEGCCGRADGRCVRAATRASAGERRADRSARRRPGMAQQARARRLLRSKSTVVHRTPDIVTRGRETVNRGDRVRDASVKALRRAL